MPNQSLAVPSGSATGNPRNLTALKPGRSLMDWVKLTHAQPDLAGTGGAFRNVTTDELAKHNKPTDAWLAHKGLVYNITPYLEYHPGGEDEIMKGAGKDATTLFNDVHPWVNIESMMKKCLIGRLRPSNSILKQIADLPWWSKSKGKNESCLVVKDETPAQPRHDWFQTLATVTIIIYTKWMPITTKHASVECLENGKLSVNVIVENYSLLLHWCLHGSVLLDDIKISTNKTGKVEIVLKKCSEGLWPNIGTAEPNHGTWCPVENCTKTFRPWQLIHKSKVTHDTFFFMLRPPNNFIPGVPLGWHVQLQTTISEQEVIRNYTPVSLLNETLSDNNLRFLIKIYPNGVYTPHLNDLNAGDEIPVSDCTGSFNITRLTSVKKLVLLAAGTGFTPMTGLLKYAIERSIATDLLMFNKTEQDIPWQLELDSLKENNAINVVHILSEASSSWAGLKGRIRKDILKSAGTNSDVTDIESILVCICGPIPFTKEAEKLVKDLGYKNSHTFLG